MKFQAALILLMILLGFSAVADGASECSDHSDSFSCSKEDGCVWRHRDGSWKCQDKRVKRAVKKKGGDRAT